MLDEMAVCKHVEWHGKQFRGYVELGTGNKCWLAAQSNRYSCFYGSHGEVRLESTESQTGPKNA